MVRKSSAFRFFFKHYFHGGKGSFSTTQGGVPVVDDNLAVQILEFGSRRDDFFIMVFVEEGIMYEIARPGSSEVTS